MNNRVVILCMFALVFISCKNNAQNFPDTIVVSKTPEMRRIKGTRMFVHAPANYQPMESLMRLQRDNDTYFQVIHAPGSNFHEAKSGFSRSAIEAKGAKVDIVKTINYNGYEGIYSTGPSKTAGESKLGIVFGDSTFATILIGVYKSSDKEAEAELNRILTNSYYDAKFDLDPMELVKFSFDESITGFHHTTTFGNFFIYSAYSAEEFLRKEGDLPAIQVSVFECPSFLKLLDMRQTIFSSLKKGNRTFQLMTEKEIFVHGNKGTEATIDITDPKGKKMSIVACFLFNGTHGMGFVGVDNGDSQWDEKFRKTVQTIKF